MKAVIPAAGMGTRLLPATKEQPKEMLPLFAKASSGQACLKPLLQLVFERLYDTGFREFYFIIGREKRAIEDHFTPDTGYISMLRRRGKNELADELENFYRRIENSTIVWVNQPVPKGFGDAVLKIEPFVKNEPVLVHAGDTYVISEHDRHIKDLIKAHAKLRADVVLILQWIKDPRQYGIAEVTKIKGGVFRVKKVVEKPERPTSHLAIMPIYIFRPVIFKALKETPPGKGNEIQLTDGIQKLIDWGFRVYALKLNPKDVRLDIGTTETYRDALEKSYRYMRGKFDG
jgi:UTP--glucose-1-phosphate uridylyltransferase